MRPSLMRAAVALAFTATAATIPGCKSFMGTFGTEEQKLRAALDPIQIIQFYTTRYEGKIKQKYEKWKWGEPYYFCAVEVDSPPPKISSFRRGERICFVVIALPTGNYLDRYGTQRRHSGICTVTVKGTDIEMEHFAVGGVQKKWKVVGVISKSFFSERDRRQYSRNPDNWEWLDNLAPGTYTAQLKVDENPTKRINYYNCTFTIR